MVRPPAPSRLRYLAEIARFSPLTRAEENALAKRISRGDPGARKTLIESNLRLVVAIAARYDDYGVPLEDLIQAGNLGLMIAAERFRPHKRAKFSTYAEWWIRHRIRSELDRHSRILRLPARVSRRLSLISAATHALRERLGREPSDGEIAHETKLSHRLIERYRPLNQAPIRLDMTVASKDSEGVLAYMLAQQDGNDVVERLDVSLACEYLRSVLPLLNKRDALILQKRFGLNGGRPESLESVGRQLNLSRERVRQLQNRSLLQLRKWMEGLEPVPRCRKCRNTLNAN